jgi:CheY-like chemotaxis protein
VYADAEIPDIVLLDLNLPRKDGREVLAELKADPELAHLPVLVLTSSAAEKDLVQTYRLHANCFVQKPVELEQYFDVVRAIENFWLAVAKLPPRNEGTAGPAIFRL